MPRLPPIKNTAGEGFAVENAVVAWLACHLLAGVPWPNAHAGSIRALNCQMRQDGWHFDDVVVEVVGGSGDFDIGCSVKSFPVFGPEGAPADFVAAIWKQWLSTDTPFKRGRDQLAIFAAGHTHEIAESWKSLLDAAHAMTAETLARRHAEQTEPSASKRAAFASMRCPQALDASSHANREETARLLAGLSLQENDFDHSDSRSVVQAIALCQQSLADSVREQAGDLWEAILTFAAEVRQKGGTINLPRLLSRLARRFPLKQHPAFAADWERMRSVSAEEMVNVPAKIGGIVTVERRELLNRISNVAAPGRCAAILGSSGYGKTVLALAWVSLDPAATAIWIRSSHLTISGGLRSVWSLRHGIAEIFANAATPVRVVLDGLDRCFNDEAFGEAALILKASAQAEVQERCQVVITCRPDDWDRVRRHLVRHGVVTGFESVAVREISHTELEAIARQIPALRALVQRPHLRSLLCWPKALDIVAMHWTDGSASPTWVSESDFARWFWQSAITREERISTRGRVARKLATLVADRLSIAARVDEFAPEELTALRELHQERHVEVDDIRQTVRFTHDLVADFARLRELQAQGESAAAYLRTRLHSPFWHRAVRIYGLDLLEQQADSAQWERFFAQFSEQTPTDEMAQNLLLEAPVFALNQGSALGRLWPVLAADGGKLLRRFLRQFLRVATVPNEHILAQFRDRGPDFQLEIAVRHRWPFVPFWLGVLGFLDSHCAEVVGLARREVAEVCLLWLPLATATSLGMRHAANLAVTSARVFYRSGEKRYSSHHKVSAEEKVCEALLAAAPVMPEEVTELVLKLSGRRVPDPEDGLSTAEPEHRSRLFPPPGPPRPWPEGPQISPVPVFCRAFMNGSAAEPFLDALPEVAAEVMFATLLDIPREGHSPNDIHDFDEHGFRRGELRYETLFWTSGPFLTFLRVQPDTALKAIIRLVNFGTDRGLELREDYRTPIDLPMTVDGETVVWRGHQYSYLWHRGHFHGPWAVCCALMSLERWLYLLMDADQPFEPHLATILRESRSIALGAVLISVGKRKPELFLGVLRPILAAVGFYRLEEIAQSPTNTVGFHSPMWTEPETIRKAWSEWMQLPHRKEILGQLAMRMFLSHPKWRAAIKEICEGWQVRLDAATEENPAPVWLPRMIAQFDLSNWRAQSHESGTLLTFEPPPTLPQPTAEDKERLQRFEKLSLLPFECRQILMGEKESTDEKIAAWWDDLPAIRALAVPDDERGARDVEDAVCGIVAVAIVHHRQWLAADPARGAEARNILEKIGAEPPGRFWFGEDDVSDDRWDNFAAWALTTLWVEKPNDPFLREAVAGLAMWERYLVVERVLRVAAAHRGELGEHFDQLLAHTIRYAQVRYIVQMEEFAQEKTFDLETWAKRHVDEYCNNKTSPLPGEWAEIRDAIPGRFWGGGMTNNFDFGHINAALAWAENLDQSRDETERRAWLHLHRQAMLCGINRMEQWARLAEETGGEEFADPQRKSPYRDEDNLLRRIAGIVARLRPGEPHAFLWQPILALGADASRWVQSFISHWLLEAAGHDHPAPALIEQWVAMLDFAENCEAWKKETERSWDMDDTWKDLLGLSPFSSDFWHAELAPAVHAIRPHFERWALPQMSSDHTVCTIIYFLKTKAAVELRMDGLGWLRAGVPLDSPYFWKEDSTQNAFAGFLRLLYDEHWMSVASAPSARETFMNFALKLSALQHPLGSELLTLAGNRLGAQ
jgi:hypothetical protein